MPGYVRAEIPRWKKQANRRVLRSDAAKAHLDIEALEKICLQSASTADVPAITRRFSFLRSFVVSHVNLEIERDFEDMDAQHTQLLKEMGAFRGQLSKLNSKIFKTSDPRLMKAGSKFCFRCKSDSHDVKKCTEPRKRKAVSKGDVLDVQADETPTQVECFLDTVPMETLSDVAMITAQQVVPDPVQIREEPAPAQLEHSTPAEVELASPDELGGPAPAQLEHSLRQNSLRQTWFTFAAAEVAAADMVEEPWEALARKCQAAVQVPGYPDYYVKLPTTTGFVSGLGTYKAAGMRLTSVVGRPGWRPYWNPHIAQDSDIQREWRATRPKPQHGYQKYQGPRLDGNLPLSQTGLAQQEIEGGVLRGLVLRGPAAHEPRATGRGNGLVHTADGPVPLISPPCRFDPSSGQDKL